MLDGPQQLGLDRERQLANLVEEEGPAACHLELARTIGRGAGEGPAHVAEELASDEVLGQSGAVHVQHGLGPARRRGVHAARDQLFARARLADDQHRVVRASDEVHLLPQPSHDRRGSEQLGALAELHVAHQVSSDESLSSRALLERLDELGGAQLGGGQGRDRSQEARVDVVEGTRLGRVRGERPDQLVTDAQGAAEARMDAPGGLGEQTVERVRQLGVAGKQHGLLRATDELEARMLLGPEASAHGVVRQTGARDGNQVLALSPEQDGGVVGDDSQEGAEQPAVALFRRQRRRQIGGDRYEGRGSFHRCGFYNEVVFGTTAGPSSSIQPPFVTSRNPYGISEA